MTSITTTIFLIFFRLTGTLHVDRAFQSMRVEPVTTCIPPDGEERLSQEERSSSFFLLLLKNSESVCGLIARAARRALACSAGTLR